MLFTLKDQNGIKKKYGCGNIWFTSDTHFHQERAFKLSKRDNVFSSIKEMDIELLSSIENIPKDDILIHLGDVGEVNSMKRMVSCHENTILILGNYETNEMVKFRLSFSEYRTHLLEDIGFLDVYENYAILYIDNLNNWFFLTHDPKYFADRTKELGITYEQYEKVRCLFGHIHGRQMIKRFGLDVGVDAHHFKPISIDDVMFYIEAIDKYYDESVFC